MNARAALAGAIALVAFTATSVSRAAPRDPVKADALFREGQRLLAAGDLNGACPMLADSYALDPALGTLLNLAFCHEKQGRLFTAWTEFRRAEADATRTEQRERASFARTQMRALEARLPRARVELPPGVRATQVRIDDASIDAPIDEVLFVPPGSHAVDVETSTGEHLAQTVAFPDAPSSTTVVRFAARARDDAPASPQAPPSAPGDDDPWAGRRTLGYGLAGVGIIALGAGGYFGIATLAKKSDASNGCSADGCTPQGKHDGDLAHTYATASTALVIVGVVAAAAGVYLVLTSTGSRTAARPPTLRVAF